MAVVDYFVFCRFPTTMENLLDRRGSFLEEGHGPYPYDLESPLSRRRSALLSF